MSGCPLHSKAETAGHESEAKSNEVGCPQISMICASVTACCLLPSCVLFTIRPIKGLGRQHATEKDKKGVRILDFTRGGTAWH